MSKMHVEIVSPVSIFSKTYFLYLAIIDLKENGDN